MARSAKIKVKQMYVVELYEDGVLVETRELPNKSLDYANDVEENWLNGVIKILEDTGEQD